MKMSDKNKKETCVDSAEILKELFTISHENTVCSGILLRYYALCSKAHFEEYGSDNQKKSSGFEINKERKWITSLGRNSKSYFNPSGHMGINQFREEGGKRIKCTNGNLDSKRKFTIVTYDIIRIIILKNEIKNLMTYYNASVLNISDNTIRE